MLSFHPSGDVKSIVGGLVDNMDKFQDWDNPLYSNIQSLKKIESQYRRPFAGRSARVHEGCRHRGQRSARQ